MAIPTTAKQGMRAFIDGWGSGEEGRVSGNRERGYMQKQHSQLWQSSWKWSSDQHHLVLRSVNFQFQGQFVPISLWPVLWIVAARVQVQSGHHVVSFYTWGFSTYKTAHRMWLRILSTDLEKELKALDDAYWQHYYCLVSFECFPFFQHFSFLWLNFLFDWNFPQAKGRWRMWGWGARMTGSCSVSITDIHSRKD